MTKIRVLPEILANKIAAGEIVERPASVVKELLENAIDAGARMAQVSVQAGGKRQICVRDDGEGMTQDDAILAFEHHATSKIRAVEDLGAIATLGFRGEALPAIASVSRLVLRTRSAAEPDSASGTELVMQGGTLRTVKPVAWDVGTEVSVRDLFFNVPARRKFLRSHQTELGHITRLVTNYALAHPEIRFSMESDGRRLLDAVGVSTLKDRVCQIFGEEFFVNMVETSGKMGSVSMHGFASLPHEQRTNPYSQFFYVNRRMVRDKVLTSAVRQAYRNVIPGSAYPVVLVFLELPFDQVDVNAHPAKTEIRFREQGVVHDLVRESIAGALVRSRSVSTYQHREHIWPARGEDHQAEASRENWAARTVPGPAFDFTPPSASLDPFQRAFNYPFRDPAPDPLSQEAEHHTLKVRADLLMGATAENAPSPFHASGVRILGQIHQSYIIASDNHGLLIVDQHVAHERILYEKLAGEMRTGAVETQGLLVPKTIELTPPQIAILDRIMTELNRNGFEVDRFGGNSIVIRSVPAVAGGDDCGKLIAEILEGMEREERTLDVDQIRDRIAVSTACRAAIKVNMQLTVEKMQWLIDELGRARVPTNCPHGRPIILRFTLHEIERNFGRI